MKNLTHLLLLVVFYTANAQGPCKTFTTGDTEKKVCYFTTGEKSTETNWLKTQVYWKTFVAFDKAGNEIYKREYGRKWGSSNCDVSYYPNGALRTAHYTMQPDGGIQHTDITTYFTPEGKIDHEDDRSIGNDGTMHPGILRTEPGTTRTPVKTMPFKPAPNQCTPVPPGATLYVINGTTSNLNLSAQYLTIPAGPINKISEAGDTCAIGIFYPNPLKQNPLEYYRLAVKNMPRSGFTYAFSWLQGEAKDKQFVLVSYQRVGNKKRPR